MCLFIVYFLVLTASTYRGALERLQAEVGGAVGGGPASVFWWGCGWELGREWGGVGGSSGVGGMEASVWEAGMLSGWAGLIWGGLMWKGGGRGGGRGEQERLVRGQSGGRRARFGGRHPAQSEPLSYPSKGHPKQALAVT